MEDNAKEAMEDGTEGQRDDERGWGEGYAI